MIRRVMVLILSLAVFSGYTFAGEGPAGMLEPQNMELNRKEELIKKEMLRIKVLKTEVEEDIIKYNDLLKKIELSLQKAEAIGNKRLKHVARAYEAMPPEDAASRLGGLDNKTAVQILLKMNSKKAGLVIGMMEARKATALTKEITKIKK